MLSIFKNLFSPFAEASELKQAIKNETYLVDVRSSYEFSHGSLRGAVNIPLPEIKNKIKELKGKKNLVLFCRSGNRSNQAKILLEQNGIQNVFNGGSLSNVQRILDKIND